MFPIPIAQLKKYLPHREPMIWIDSVDFVDEVSGRATVVVKSSLPYFQNGTPLRMAPIEWMAQTAGYCAAARIHIDGNGPNRSERALPFSRTYLAGIRNARLGDISRYGDGTVFTIHLTLVRELPPLSLVRGEVRVGECLVAEAILKLYGE